MNRTTLVCTLALAFTTTAAHAQRLIAIDSSRAMSQIHPTTAVRTPIGTASSNAGTCGGLAYDSSTGTMYLTSTTNDSLYTLDVATGAATLVGAYGDPLVVMHGLEFDSSTGTLYGVSQHNNGLYNIDKVTGTATLIGTSGLASFTNLVYHSATDTMYATNSGADSFYLMDRATGATTLIGPLGGPTNPNGLAYDYETNTVYLVCNSTDTLYTINVLTGAATAVAPYGASNLLGLVYVPGSITRTVHGCGATTITTTGNTGMGSAVTTTLGGLTGVPFIGLGLVLAPTPFCTCTVGHEWAVVLFGSTNVFNVPVAPVFIGLTIGIQGAELNSVGGCPAPAVSFTDTMVLRIG